MKTYYFLGIGGIGMSAIARYFLLKGDNIFGYDLTRTELTQELEKEGMSIVYEDNIDLLPKDIDMVIYTPAIPKDNTIFNYFINSNTPILKRSEILAEITRDKKTIAISGTHGKTTVSTMVAHLLNNSSIGCSAFLGGISKNLNSNFLYNPNSQYIVVEADEYDRSFLKLSPYYSVITSIDEDHLDIYGEYKNLLEAFREFANKTQDEGRLFIKQGLDLELKEELVSQTYTIRGIEADYYAWNIRNYNSKYYFDLRTPEKVIYDLCLNYPGIHNIENILVSSAIALKLGVSEDELRKGIESFSGVRRRFDIRIKTKDFVYIDDYAHHPNEIKSCIESIRDMFPGKKLTGVFQPHLFSRTRDFADEFARALEGLDEVVLLDIYPAREKPIENINSKWLLHKINKMDKYYSEEDGLLDLLDALYPEVLLTIGAGNIDRFVGKIEERFSE
ncbi:MAG: UDP-N-acetylmuramate--L-alanine ligase [Bacteroidales bacterium]|jgi:UDP-N-acetylmuramate--alanine ligase|nr:UDP-N-acetylmuramate--L-alanine ligase [Bacteroidales bacterium]